MMPSPTSEPVKLFLEETTTSIEPAHDGAHGTFHDVGDLLVGKSFDVAENDRKAKVGGQRFQRLFDRFGHALLDEQLFRSLLSLGALLNEHAVGCLLFGDRGVEDFAPSFAALIGIDERVAENFEEPRLAVGIFLKGIPKAVGAEHGVLHQIFGVSGVPSEAIGGAKERIQMRKRYLLEVFSLSASGEHVHISVTIERGRAIPRLLRSRRDLEISGG